MHSLMNPRRLALTAAVLVGTFAGTWAPASPIAPTEVGVSSTRHCANTICTNRLWLRAPILRTHAR